VALKVAVDKTDDEGRLAFDADVVLAVEAKSRGL
jgi:hypothetical protein